MGSRVLARGREPRPACGRQERPARAGGIIRSLAPVFVTELSHAPGAGVPTAPGPGRARERAALHPRRAARSNQLGRSGRG